MGTYTLTLPGSDRHTGAHIYLFTHPQSVTHTHMSEHMSAYAHTHKIKFFFPPVRTAKAISGGWFLIRNSHFGVFLPLAQWGVGEDEGGRRVEEGGEGPGGRSPPPD